MTEQCREVTEPRRGCYAADGRPYLDVYRVTTTEGRPFEGVDHALLAYLILRRWGHDADAAHPAWCRLFQNNCTRGDFAELANYGRTEYGRLHGAANREGNRRP